MQGLGGQLLNSVDIRVWNVYLAEDYIFLLIPLTDGDVPPPTNTIWSFP